MLEKIKIDNPLFTDLNMYKCGFEDCAPGHSWGPGVRDHFLIHYIHSGKGTFQINNTTYRLGRGQGFLICPNVITHYCADMEEPWSYSWVGFNGLKAESYLKQAGLTLANPVFKYDMDNLLSEYFSQMIETKKLTKSREIQLVGLLYLLLSRLIEISEKREEIADNKARKKEYIKKAVDFISRNYSRKITVTEISHHIGLDRSYLFSIFKEFLNMSPREFLINYRIDKACELMGNNLLSIGDISRSVGYEDTLLFSKVFKKFKGMSPRNYRKTLNI